MISDQIQEILKTIPSDVCLVAATKYVTAAEMKELLKYGIFNFGENNVDDFLKKKEELKTESVCWHFIGHLQRNKASKVINEIDYLHSLDSLKLAEVIEKHRIRPLKCFVEVNLSREPQKNGVLLEDLDDFIQKLLPFSKIELYGLMTMTNPNDSDEQKQSQFEHLKQVLKEVNRRFGLNLEGLSMGISEDYLLAISAGATHIRLGRILWKNLI